MMDDELHDYDGPGLPSVVETGRRYVCLPEDQAERIEPGAEAARRDDLAHDIARLWRAADFGLSRGIVLPSDITEALDRLAEAYGLEEVQEKKT